MWVLVYKMVILFLFDLVPLFLLIFFFVVVSNEIPAWFGCSFDPPSSVAKPYILISYIYRNYIWNWNRIGLHNKMKWIMRFHSPSLVFETSQFLLEWGQEYFKNDSFRSSSMYTHLQPTVAWWTTSTRTILSVKAKSPFPVWMTAKKWGWLT